MQRIAYSFFLLIFALGITNVPLYAQNYPPSFSKSRRCGDGICDDNEQTNPNLCPQDCYIISNESIKDRETRKNTDEDKMRRLSSYTDSPFGVHAPFGGEANPLRKDIDIGNIEYLTDIDAKWVRILEPELISAGESLNKNNIKILSGMTQAIFPKDIERYKKEKTLLVRKYKDIVDAWLVVNEAELNWRDTLRRFVEYFAINTEIIRKEDPTAKIVFCLAGGRAEGGRITPRVQKFLEEALSNGIGEYFDVLDFHHQGTHNEYPDVSEKISIFGRIFNKYGVTGKEFWITEFGTHDGDPEPNMVMDPPYQSEKIQACGLVKKHIYALAHGAKKMFWTTMTEWSAFGGSINDYFTNVGLINNPSIDGQAHKKLAYYAYKKMVDILDGSDWNDISIIRESDGIYVYKFVKNGKSIWVVWNENKNEHSITLTLDKDIKNIRIIESVPKYQSGKEVADYNIAFTESDVNIPEGNLSETDIKLKGIPVFVQKIETGG